MHVYLETERMIFRRFMPADVDLVTALDADPAVMRYINEPPITRCSKPM